jgi:hypothetical protein
VFELFTCGNDEIGRAPEVWNAADFESIKKYYLTDTVAPAAFTLSAVSLLTFSTTLNVGQSARPEHFLA